MKNARFGFRSWLCHFADLLVMVLIQGRKAGIMKHCASLTPVPCSPCPLTASLGYFDRKEFQGLLFFHWLTVVIHYIMRLR